MPGTISVSRLRISQLPEASRIYGLPFPSSPLTWLGSEVRKRYLAWLLEGPEALVAFGASYGNGLEGFCFLVSDDPAASFVGSHKLLLLRSALKQPAALRRAGLARLARLLFRPGPVPVTARPRRFIVYLIAVHPSCQGRGVGSALLDACEAAARDRDVREMFLRVHPDNSRAVRFYEGRGWKMDRKKGSWSGLLRKELSWD